MRHPCIYPPRSKHVKHRDYDELFRIIESNSKFVITSHMNPDGDSIGSQMAFYNYLRQKGKKNVSLISHSFTPDYLTFLDKKNVIKVYRTCTEKCNRLIQNADVIFLLDTNDFARTKTLEKVMEDSPAKKVCIDHHLGINKRKFVLSIPDVDEPATSSVLYDLFVYDNPDIINKSVAEYLYAGIMTDTGSFRYPRTTEKTFLVCADLIRRGADPVIIYDKTYNRLNGGKIRLLGKFIESITYYLDGTLAIGTVTQEDFRKYHTDVEDVDGFSAFLMSIKGVKTGFVIVELKNSLKLSLRSKGNINIRNFAKSIGGGGHKNASGATLEPQKPSEAKKFLLEKYLQFTKNGK